MDLNERLNYLASKGLWPRISLQEGYDKEQVWSTRLSYGSTIFDSVVVRNKNLIESLKMAERNLPKEIYENLESW